MLAAQMSATRLLEQLDHGTSPQLVLWPEDVVSLDTPLSESPGAVRALRPGPDASTPPWWWG